MGAAIVILGIVILLPFVAADQPVYGQCSGIGYTGSTVCTAGSVCTYLNPYYSQCLLERATTSTTSITSITSTTSTTSTTSVASTSTTASAPTSISSTATTTTTHIPPPPVPAEYKIIVGGYSHTLSTLLFSPNTRPPAISLRSQINLTANPSWITLHPTKPSILYATEEAFLGGALTFTLDSNGRPTLVATVPTGGDPAFLTTINNATELFIPNYTSGTIESVAFINSGRSFGIRSAVLQLVGSGPNLERQANSHPYQAVQNGGEILVPDLGADKVWRLVKNGTAWQVAGFVQHLAGSGPRHIVVQNQTLYTIHELTNTITQHTLPALGSGIQPQLVATLPIISPGTSNTTTANTTLSAGEIFISPVTSSFPTQYLYASNRGDPNPAGDTIAIFALNPLRLVNQVRTGLQQLLGMAIGGDRGQYIITGGLTGGGIKVFQRINGGWDLVEVASLQGIASPSSFVFV